MQESGHKKAVCVAARTHINNNIRSALKPTSRSTLPLKASGEVARLPLASSTPPTLPPDPAPAPSTPLLIPCFITIVPTNWRLSHTAQPPIDDPAPWLGRQRHPQHFLNIARHHMRNHQYLDSRCPLSLLSSLTIKIIKRSNNRGRRSPYLIMIFLC